MRPTVIKQSRADDFRLVIHRDESVTLTKTIRVLPRFNSAHFPTAKPNAFGLGIRIIRSWGVPGFIKQSAKCLLRARRVSFKPAFCSVFLLLVIRRDLEGRYCNKIQQFYDVHLHVHYCVYHNTIGDYFMLCYCVIHQKIISPGKTFSEMSRKIDLLCRAAGMTQFRPQHPSCKAIQ